MTVLRMHPQYNLTRPLIIQCLWYISTTIAMPLFENLNLKSFEICYNFKVNIYIFMEGELISV